MLGFKTGFVLFCLIFSVSCQRMPKECEQLFYKLEKNGPGYLKMESGKKLFAQCLIIWKRFHRNGKRSLDHNNYGLI